MTITLRQESDAGATTKGSALTYAELDNNFIDLIAKLSDVVDDTSPQLGGNLDVNGNTIVSTSNGNITLTPDGTGDVVLGNYTLDVDQTVGAGEDNYVLKYDNATGKISLEAGESGGISNVSEDTSPQLGGNLDMNSFDIVTTSNATIDLAPNGTGHVEVRGNTNAGTIQLNCENNSHGQKIRSQPHSEAVTNIMLMPKGGDSTLVSEIATQTLTNKTLGNYKETVHTISTDSAGAINIDVADGPIQEITLNENVTFSGFTNPEDGQSVTLILIQDGTGSRTFTEDSANTILFAGGTSTLSTAANAIDIMTIVRAGGVYYASLATNFS